MTKVVLVSLPELLKKEGAYLLLVLLALFAALKIAFFREDAIIVFRTAFALFWLFVLPGFSVLLYWKEHLSFLQRLIISIPLSAALIGIASYYLALVGFNVNYHAYILPPVMIAAGVVCYYRGLSANKDVE
jgi:hypothetical protein